MLNYESTFYNLSELNPADYNPRKIDKSELEKLKAGIRKYGLVQPIVANADMTVIGGHQRLEAISQMAESGEIERNPSIPCVIVDLPKSEEKALNLALNKISGKWDHDKLGELLQEIKDDTDDIDELITGFDDSEIEAILSIPSDFDPSELIASTSMFDTSGFDIGTTSTPKTDPTPAPESKPEPTGTAAAYDPALAEKGAMVRKYIVPPFSTLDARQGYWKDRKKYWMDVVGIDTVKGRDEMHSTVDMPEYAARGERFGGSSFDPVLAEVIFNWFMPTDAEDGYSILDPFGGESTKGIVAGALDYAYTGVELRKEQVEANIRQWDEVSLKLDKYVVPTWIQGDSAKIDSILPEGEWADLIFTSPPYYDLEIYSKSEKDGSAFETYEKFMEWYQDIFRQCVARLKPNRFVVVKIGEVRADDSFYYNFVGDNIRCFTELGLRYYNEAVLITPVGSLPIRAPRPFNQSRKLAKAHQNVLVFYKGDDIKDISRDFKTLDDTAVPSEETEG